VQCFVLVTIVFVLHILTPHDIEFDFCCVAGVLLPREQAFVQTPWVIFKGVGYVADIGDMLCPQRGSGAEEVPYCGIQHLDVTFTADAPKKEF